MPLPSGPEPWFGLSPETLRFLEVHTARAIAIPGRGWRDFGDAVMLFSGSEKDPFFNRLTAIRWPEDPAAFDARLAQALELFAALERKPYCWVVPGMSAPPDIVGRLAANGFIDQGGGFDMLLTGDPRAVPDVPLPRGSVLERHHDPSPADRIALAADLALVISESFHIPELRRGNLPDPRTAALPRLRHPSRRRARCHGREVHVRRRELHLVHRNPAGVARPRVRQGDHSGPGARFGRERGRPRLPGRLRGQRGRDAAVPAAWIPGARAAFVGYAPGTTALTEPLGQDCGSIRRADPIIRKADDRPDWPRRQSPHRDAPLPACRPYSQGVR
jgi:hypothetical protein